jgi:hypothetical protein
MGLLRRLLQLLLLTAVAVFAAVPVQVGPNTCVYSPGLPGSGSFTCVFPNPVSHDNILVVSVGSRFGTSTGVTSIVDDRGTSYALGASTNGTYTFEWMYVGKPPTDGANTVTVTIQGTYYFGWITMAEYKKTDLTNTVTDTKVLSGTASPGVQPSCGAFTPSQTNVQVIAGIFHNDTSATPLTPSSPMVARVSGASATLRQALLEDYFMATPASITPGGTDVVAQNHFSCAAIALASAGTPSPTLTSITPGTGVQGASVPVTLTGTALTGATAISAGSGITVSSIAVVNATTVTASFGIDGGATPGVRDVVITTPAGTSGAVVFTVTAAAARKRIIQSSTVVGGEGVFSEAPQDWSLVWFSDSHPSPTTGEPEAGNTNYAISKEVTWNTKGYFFTGDVNTGGSPVGGDHLWFYNHGWSNILARNKPTIASIGNHDCLGEDCGARSTVAFDTHIGYSKVSAAAYGPVAQFTGVGNDLGHYPDAGGTLANYAIRFAVNGHKFLVIAFELFPRDGAMDWASNLAALYPDHKIIYLDHAYLLDGNIGGTPGRPCRAALDAYCAGNGGAYNQFTSPANGGVYSDGQFLYDHLIKLQANGFLTLGGHFIGRTPHYSQFISTGTNGNPLVGLMYNYQEMGAAGNNMVARLSFHESTAKFDFIIMDSTTDTVVASLLGMTWPQ